MLGKAIDQISRVPSRLTPTDYLGRLDAMRSNHEIAAPHPVPTANL